MLKYIDIETIEFILLVIGIVICLGIGISIIALLWAVIASLL